MKNFDFVRRAVLARASRMSAILFRRPKEPTAGSSPAYAETDRGLPLVRI